MEAPNVVEGRLAAQVLETCRDIEPQAREI